MKTQKSKPSRFPQDFLKASNLERPPFTFAHYSIASERHPERNEDALISDQRRGIAAVFDGVGGSSAGEVASGIAKRRIRRGWSHYLEQQQSASPTTLLESCDPRDLSKILVNLVQEAHEHICTDKTPRKSEGKQRTGTEDRATTIALAIFCQRFSADGYQMVYVFVGDSRIYLLRGDKGLTCLTQDDGYLTKLVHNHMITQADALRIDQASKPDELSESELTYFHKRNGITQALGDPQPLVIHHKEITIYPGDRLLLCTDGIHDNLTDQEMEEIIKHSTRTTSARALVDHALQRSRQGESLSMRAKPDDMSALVVTCNR